MNHQRFFIRDQAGRFLDTYGPTLDEISWTTDQKTAFRMTKVEADHRLEVIQRVCTGLRCQVYDPEARFFWYVGGHHTALVEDGVRTLITLPNVTKVTPEMQEIADAMNGAGRRESLATAVEFGFRQCEKGNNLDMALANFSKLFGGGK